MKRFAALGLVLTALAWPPPGGIVLAVLIETQTRSACPIAGGPCSVGAMYQLLHPGPAGFDHVFGGLLFVAALLLPLLSAALLARSLRARWSSL